MDGERSRILVVDDEDSMLGMLNVVLSDEGYEVVTTPRAEHALDAFRDSNFDLVLQDLKMPGMDGITFLSEIKGIDQLTPVIVMTAFSTWDTAVEAMQLGAYDYIKKPFDIGDVKVSIARAIAMKRLHDNSGSHDTFLRNIVGHSPQMQDVFKLIKRVAATDSTVIIQGESGTGKELVARALHAGSMRADRPFISVNCGAFTETLLESELFGHVRGSFTGAVSNKKGLFEIAEHGSLFLDELGELSPKTQVKLLRVLEERSFYPVGGSQPKKVDVRVIAATNRDLEEEVRRGNFREDLFYRLNVIPVTLPTLRDRQEDIPLLAGHFLARYSTLMGKEVLRISEDSMASIVNYDWPGNIRELENVIQRGVALADGDTIDCEHLADKILAAPERQPEETELPPEGLDLDMKLDEIERNYILRALHRTNWHMTQAAHLLGMPFRSLRYRVKKLNIRRPSEELVAATD